MARARNIKPGFFMNEDLTELPFEYRLLFIGLWTLADREGKLEDRPKRIKMELFPADNVDVDHGLSELERYGFVERYEVDGLRIVMILKFADHQRPHHTEKASELPNKDGSMPVAALKESRGETGKPGSNNGEITVKGALSDGGNPPDSLNPDSLNPDFLNKPPIPPSGGLAEPEAPKKKKQPKRDEPSQEFLLAWNSYPKRDGPNPRKTAWDAWKARIRAGTDPSELLAGVKRYAAWIEDKGQSGTRFVMMASTFFGPGEHWRERYGGPVEPEWWRPAGFTSRFDAENAGCTRFIADQFREGRRVEVLV